MPAVPWKDGASRTVVLAGAGREWGSSVEAGEGLLSVIPASPGAVAGCSQGSGSPGLETSQLQCRAGE